MPTDEIIIRLFCMVDDELGVVNKRSDAYLYRSEIVTIGLLFALKGGRFRAFYRWLNANYRDWFPALPERSRLQRLLRDHAEDVMPFLAEPSFFTVVDTFGIELIHPRREGRSKKQIGKKGKSNGRWIVGIKLAWLINDAGEVVDWTWDTANEPDNVFRPLATGYDGEVVALGDMGFRQKDAPTQNIKCCERNTWNERFTIETNFSWLTELFHSKKLYHRVKTHLEAHLWYMAALMNCLLRLTEHKRSLIDFVI
jgi:hypothetical protein